MLRDAVADLASRLGLLLVDLSWTKFGRRGILRILVDRPGRITIGECASFSRQVEDLLDRDLVIDGSYMLEVSSPGITRRLESEVDWIRCVGRRLHVELEAESFEDELLGYSGGCLSFPGRTVPASMVVRAVEVVETSGRRGERG